MLNTTVATQNPTTTQQAPTTSARRIHLMQANPVVLETLLPQALCVSKTTQDHTVLRVAGQPQ
jgi:hypothetical protein